MRNRNWYIVMTAVVSTLITIVGIGILGLLFFNTKTGSIDRARLLDEHGFSDEARLLLIEMTSGPFTRITQTEEDLADGLHLLGEIALKGDNLAGAIVAWNSLVDGHPNSEQANSVKERIDELKFEFRKNLSDLESSLRAKSYFANADLWLRSTEVRSPPIDTSFIPSDEAAFDWFNQVIEDFPGTSHAELAYERMIEYLLGKAKIRLGYPLPGQYSAESRSEYLRRLAAILNDARSAVKKGVTLAVPILEDFEESFPNSNKLQRLRYLIGQMYWLAGDLESARLWLGRVIHADLEENTFYRDLAFRRLENLPDCFHHSGVPSDLMCESR